MKVNMKVLIFTPDLYQKGGVASYYQCSELEKDMSYFTVNDE